ncbi:Uncharacterised protein [Vibrio cholerae]|nr:Uncharacterised protein [Vibrio cholerae]
MGRSILNLFRRINGTLLNRQSVEYSTTFQR